MFVLPYTMALQTHRERQYASRFDLRSLMAQSSLLQIPKRQSIAAEGSVTITGEMKVKDPVLVEPVQSFSIQSHCPREGLRACYWNASLTRILSLTGFEPFIILPTMAFFSIEQHFKVRGFCDHNNFAVVGMAVPDRINLFRAQALRSIGGNARRMSHNPPSPIVLDIYDRLGTIVMDENRLFDDNAEYVENMRALVTTRSKSPGRRHLVVL